MTVNETYLLLKNRLGWSDPLEAGSIIVLDADNKTSDSGRFYQEEHSAITLEIIKDLMEPITDDMTIFNTYLRAQSKKAVTQVITDVFHGHFIADARVNEHIEAFDTAISKRMAVIIMEMIITSTRKNETERITKEFANKIFYDLNGRPGSDDFNELIGIKQRYEQEITELRDTFNTSKTLDVYTLTIGERNPDIPEL